MMPAKRIFMPGRAGRAGWPRQAGRAGKELPFCLSCPSRPSCRSLAPCGFDELVDALRLVERFPDREPRAHPAVELTALEQILVSALRDDLAAIEDENAVGIPNGREAMGDDDRRAAGAQPPERREHDLFGNRIE